MPAIQLSALRRVPLLKLAILLFMLFEHLKRFCRRTCVMFIDRGTVPMTKPRAFVVLARVDLATFVRMSAANAINCGGLLIALFTSFAGRGGVVQSRLQTPIFALFELCSNHTKGTEDDCTNV
jgi:hypothetical protein